MSEEADKFIMVQLNMSELCLFLNIILLEILWFFINYVLLCRQKPNYLHKCYYDQSLSKIHNRLLLRCLKRNSSSTIDSKELTKFIEYTFT